MISQILILKDQFERVKRVFTGVGLVAFACYLVHKSYWLDPMTHSVTAAFMLVVTGLVTGLTGAAMALRALDNGPATAGR